MKKLTNYKKQKNSENLEYFFNNASEQDYKDGLIWYQTAHDIVQNLSNKYNFKPIIVANVLSALSPRNKWERNIFDTEQVLKAVNNGKGHDSIKVCTFNNNKIKAFELAQGNREGIEYSNSPKTHSFVKNIAELNENFVTVDVWHTRAAFDKMVVPTSLSASNYDDIRDITIKNAKKHNITPYQYQAIVWCSIRNN
jgi:hypothetical protein|tara:strand:- start:154 stop:741 length:588 start_codon:yes stop_codon:yes gene_type:complete